MFGLGIGELLIILLVVLVLFGAGKLPNVMGDFGKGLSEFKKGMAGIAEDEDKSSAKVSAKEEPAPTVVKASSKTAATKKPVAKKAAPKKTAAKKTTAKKAAPKKPAAKKTTKKSTTKKTS